MMNPETLMGYLVALAVPVWLLVEGFMVSRRSTKPAPASHEAGRPSSKPASTPAAVATRARAMRLADPRKSA